jgi:3-oxoacyl-[acyl-carrier protein] reductase
MDLSIKNKVAVVSGSSKGIGYATAKVLLEEGCKVAISSRHADELESARVELASFGDVFAQVCDFSKEKDVYDYAAAVAAHFGDIDIWVNNVGASVRKQGEEFTETDIDKVVGVCFKAAVFGSQAAFRYMKAHGGAIVNISSLAARCPSAGRSTLYGPMKAAILNLSVNLAGEYAAWNVRVNSVMPGFTITPAVKATISPEELAYSQAGTLLGRMAEPEEIAKVIVFLASPAASYITGASVEVSGGRCITLNPGYSQQWRQELELS